MSRYPFDYKAMLSDCPTFSLGEGGNKENGEKGWRLYGILALHSARSVRFYKNRPHLSSGSVS